MIELDTRRRDLELVRDSSLDFAQSLDMDEVLEAVVTRLLGALDMHACDIYEVDVDAGVMRNLVSYDDGAFDTGEWLGSEYPIDHFATSAMAIRSRRPVIVTSIDDPRLNYAERDLMKRWGHNTELIIPLRIREHVIALVELLDDREGRDFSDEEVELARSICRFAALAIDKARLFDQQRATAERRDRLSRRLQRLQSFAVDLNQRLDRADLQEVLDEVTRAAVDLLHVRCGGGRHGQRRLHRRALAGGGRDGAAERARGGRGRPPRALRAGHGAGRRGLRRRRQHRRPGGARRHPAARAAGGRGGAAAVRPRWSPTSRTASSTTRTACCSPRSRRSSTPACTTPSPTSAST